MPTAQKNAKFHVIFDFDQTLVPTESTVDVLRLAVEAQPNGERYLKRLALIAPKALAGVATFRELVELMTAITRIRKAHVQAYIELTEQTLHPDLQTTLNELHRENVGVHIISGGYMEWIVPLASAWGIEPQHVIANRFYWAGSRAIATRPSPLLSSKRGKSQIVRNWRAQGKLNGTTIIVGDGASDHRVFTQGAVDGFICADYYTDKTLDALGSFSRVQHQAQLLKHIQALLNTFSTHKPT